ncbi:MAG: outer membrane lipoprotein-sorting protein [Thermodesulfobacteriota bacterium]
MSVGRRLGAVAALHLVALAAIAPPKEAHAEPGTAAEVLDAARAVNAPVSDKTSRVTMRIHAPSGEERVRVLRGYEKKTPGGRKLLWLFESPTEIAGTGFLAWQQRPAPDEMWVYFPGQRRVRRVSPELRREQFQGSTFTYEDLTTVFYLDYDGTHTLRGAEPCGDQRCFVVETDLAGDLFAYRQLRTWIRVDNHLPQRIDLTGDGIRKRMTLKRWGEVEGVATVLEVEMETPDDGWRTVVEYAEVDYDAGLPDELFTVGSLSQRGK